MEKSAIRAEKNLITAAEKYLEGYRYGSEACRKGYLRCRNQSVAHQNTPDTPEA